jgi:hypothetical protein
MELTSKFSVDGADIIEGEIVNPVNWLNAFINLSFDKDSVIAKSKGVVSTTEWEWMSKTAQYLSNYQKDGLTGGHGVLIGVPFKWELLDDGGREVIFDGYLDLSKAVFQCDNVTAPSVERNQIDDLNSKVDSFTYEYLLSISRLAPSDYTYVPYAKRPIQNLGLEIVVSIIQLIILIIELQQAITELVKLIIGMATFTWADLFKAVIQTAYTLFLTVTVHQAVVNILKLIIQPIKYHAGMTELRLMQVGSSHLGYDFVSTILEDDNPLAVIVPEKWSITTQPNDDLVTGFTTVDSMLQPIDLGLSNHLEQNGYYNGTFGDVIRALKVKYNAKVIIEKSTTGGNPIIRFEREDYIGDISALYNMPPIDNNNRFRLNGDEFKSNYLIEYQLDSANKVGYVEYDGTVYQSTITTLNSNTNGIDLNLMRGLDTRSIPFARAGRKNELTKIEELTEPLVDTISKITEIIQGFVNTILWQTWATAYGMIVDINNIISAVNGLPLLGLNIPQINDSFIGTLDTIPFLDFSGLNEFSGSRIGVMEVENDFLNVPHNLTLDAVLGEVTTVDSFELFAPGALVPYATILLNESVTGDNFGNRLVANHSEVMSAKTLWENYHYINSFVPNTNGDVTDLSDLKHNQWKLYELNDVPFCYEDYLKVKSNNNIIFVDKIGRVESLEWDVYNQKANISFRINELWTNNLKLEANGAIGR